MANVLQTTFSKLISGMKIVNTCILIQISLKFVHEGPINNHIALVQIMARLPNGSKPVSEPLQWGKLKLASASAFWAGRVENWPRQVEFCMEHIDGLVLNYGISNTVVLEIP